MSEKVYCGQCEHHRIGFSNKPYEHCSVACKAAQSLPKVEHENYAARWSTPAEAEHPSIKNKSNNCPDFQEMSPRERMLAMADMLYLPNGRP